MYSSNALISLLLKVSAVKQAW